MNPDDPPRPADPGQPTRNRTVRIRVLLGVLLLLGAVNVVGPGVFRLPHRLRVELANNGDFPIRRVRVQHDGGKVDRDEIEPYARGEWWVPTRWAGKVRIAFDVIGGAGRPDQRVETEVSHRWEPGDAIRFEFYGTSVSAILNNKVDISVEASTRIDPGGKP